MVTKEQVEAALNSVTDPCSLVAGVRAGLVDMGLVTGIALDETPGRTTVRVRIGLTEPSCLMGHAFVPQATQALRDLSGGAEVEVKLDPTLDWDESKLTPAYRARLQAHRAASTYHTSPDFAHKSKLPVL